MSSSFTTFMIIVTLHLLLLLLSLSSSSSFLIFASTTNNNNNNNNNHKFLLRRIGAQTDTHNPKDEYNEGFNRIATDATGTTIYALTSRHNPSVLIKWGGYPHFVDSMMSLKLSDDTFAHTLTVHQSSGLVFVGLYSGPFGGRVLKIDGSKMKIVARADLMVKNNDNNNNNNNKGNTKSSLPTAFPFVSYSTEHWIYFGCFNDVGTIVRFKPTFTDNEEMKSGGDDFEVIRFPASSSNDEDDESTAIGALTGFSSVMSNSNENKNKNKEEQHQEEEEFLYAGTCGTIPAKIMKISVRNNNHNNNNHDQQTRGETTLSSTATSMKQEGPILVLGGGVDKTTGKPIDLDLARVESSITFSSSLLVDPLSNGKILFALTSPSSVGGHHNSNNRFHKTNMKWFARNSIRRMNSNNINNNVNNIKNRESSSKQKSAGEDFLAARLIKIITTPVLIRVGHLSLRPGEYFGRAVVAMNTNPLSLSSSSSSSIISVKVVNDENNNNKNHHHLTVTTPLHIVTHGRERLRIIKIDHTFDPSSSSPSSSAVSSLVRHDDDNNEHKQQESDHHNHEFPTVGAKGEVHSSNVIVPSKNPNFMLVADRKRPGAFIRFQYVAADDDDLDLSLTTKKSKKSYPDEWETDDEQDQYEKFSKMRFEDRSSETVAEMGIIFVLFVVGVVVCWIKRRVIGTKLIRMLLCVKKTEEEIDHDEKKI